MNKNTIIGLTLIGLIFIGFSVYNSRVATEQMAAKRVQDSIAAVHAFELAQEMAMQKVADSLNAVANIPVEQTSNAGALYSNPYLENAYRTEEQLYKLENERIAVTFTTRGAQPYEVLVKDYMTADSSDLYLMKAGMSSMGFQLYSSQYISTENFSYSLVERNDTTLLFRLYFAENSYIDHEYFLAPDSYVVDFNVNMVGMDKVVPRKASQLDMEWNIDIPRLEKGYENEKSYSTVAYKYPGDNSVDNLGLRKDSAQKQITTKLQWFAFQQQFFSAILLAENNFESGNLAMSFYPEHDSQKRLMHCSADGMINYEAAQELSIPFKFYFGPNQFSILKSEGYNFEKIVPLGRNIIGWINRFVIIPLFDLFNGSIANYGIIILLLTLIIKLVVSPLTIKSYMSSAKMNVLRPEIEKINAKYPKEQDAMKKQQEIMALYQKAGVSMFGGCLPMLLQFPILIAMFRFFPASIELRQQPFLWAEDLSTYDSIIDFGFNIPLLGDHISLFSLLCAVTMYFSAKLTQGAQMDSNPQAKSMKFMTLYFMPIFMFFICNNLSSGLTYYYFLSNIIMMIQTIVIRKFFVDEKKIMEKIRLASVKGANKPKSKFQQRLEAMQKAQQEAMREQQKNRR